MPSYMSYYMIICLAFSVSIIKSLGKSQNVVKSLKLIALLMFVQKLAKFDGGYNYLRLKTEDITFTLEKFSWNSLSTEIIETKIFSKVLSLSRYILWYPTLIKKLFLLMKACMTKKCKICRTLLDISLIQWWLTTLH